MEYNNGILSIEWIEIISFFILIFVIKINNKLRVIIKSKGVKK
jgi:hypothetical protein